MNVNVISTLMKPSPCSRNKLQAALLSNCLKGVLSPLITPNLRVLNPSTFKNELMDCHFKRRPCR